jgi:hypothetical protein
MLLAIPLSLVLISCTFYAFRTPMPPPALGGGVILTEAGARFADLDALAVRMRCLCRDGSYAHNELTVTVPDVSVTWDPSVDLRAFPLDANRALAELIGRDLKLPLLDRFCLGYELQHHSKGGPASDAAKRELDHWLRSGNFASRPLIGVRHPPQKQYTFLIPSPRLDAVYPTPDFVSGVAGIAAVYSAAIIASLVVLTWAARSLRWHRRRARNLCVRCAYSLANLTADACPECGTTRVTSPTTPH